MNFLLKNAIYGFRNKDNCSINSYIITSTNGMPDRWKYLAEQQQKTSLITFRRRWWKTVVIKTSPSHIVIRPSNTRWFQFAGWFGFGLLTVFGASYVTDLPWYERIIVMLFGLAMLHVSTSSFVLVNRIRWHPNGEKIVIFFGSVSRNKIITVPRDYIETHLYLSQKSWFKSKFKRGSAVLSIRKKDLPNSELVIAANEDQSALNAAFAMLSEFLGGVCNDKTIETIEMPDGKPLTVYKAGLTADIMGQKRLDMSIPYNSRAIFSRRWDSEMLRCAMGFVFSIFFLCTALLFSVVAPDFLVLPIMFMVSGLGMLIFSFYCFFPIWNARYVIADRPSDGLSKGPKPQLDFKDECLCKLSNIIAVQICSVYKAIDRIRRHKVKLTVFELNLVLKDHLESRINLIVDIKEERVRKIAADFAVFLGVPLLDHAGAVFQDASISR